MGALCLFRFLLTLECQNYCVILEPSFESYINHIIDIHTACRVVSDHKNAVTLSHLEKPEEV